MKLTFLGAAHEVTGSRTLLEAAGQRILIDCGLEQGADTYKNCEMPCAASEIDAVCLTHAHIDHSGMLPALVAGGFSGPIYCTGATEKLCGIMLRDSAHIQESEAEWHSRKAMRAGLPPVEPLYTLADAEAALKLFDPSPYGERREIAPGIAVTFSDAGHLLGSASILVEVRECDEERRILFSGDLGNIDRPLIRDPQSPPGADYVVIESTYGDRLHGERPDYTSQLTRIIGDTLRRGGNVVIPAFAVGRTQELLYLIRVIKEEHLLPDIQDFPVYVDSPLAVEATNVYSCGMTDYYDSETLELLQRGIDPIKFEGLRLSITSDDSRAINFDPTPKVIISASGMCDAGRIRHHLKHNLWRRDSTVLFVGYQSEGTVGRQLTEGAVSVRLFGEEIAVEAHIEKLDGISGHADMNMLIDWLSKLPHKPARVFVNHGADSVCDRFAGSVRERLGFTAEAPYSGDEFDLIADVVLHREPPVRIERSAERRQRREIAVFERLRAAGRRLLNLIERSRGCANRDLARLADQINELCDKFERK